MSSTTESQTLEISIVVPLYNEEESLSELVDQIKKSLPNRSFELIFIDDGSSDSSWNVIEQLVEDNSEVKGISLGVNQGKSYALQAGFNEVKGQYIVTMDADLQDDPAEIEQMICSLESGYDLVSGWKKKRFDPISKTIPSKFFNWVTRRAAGIHLHDFNCGLKAYRAEVVAHIQLYGELHRYIPLLAKRAGFGSITEQIVQHRARKYGRTKFGLSRFINGFLDLITILFVQKYLQKPMHFFGTIGVLLMSIGSLINLYLAGIRIFYNAGIGNRPLLFLGILLMVLGVQFLSTGFLGELINKNHIRNRQPVIRKRSE
ncbi:MAG: glycosyltransferase family 2 protein [Bacteroidota bacterium]|nr:glycosyltransferase family 2 protein [Bacteroidota bacterium]